MKRINDQTQPYFLRSATLAFHKIGVLAFNKNDLPLAQRARATYFMAGRDIFGISLTNLADVFPHKLKVDGRREYAAINKIPVEHRAVVRKNAHRIAAIALRDMAHYVDRED